MMSISYWLVDYVSILSDCAEEVKPLFLLNEINNLASIQIPHRGTSFLGVSQSHLEHSDHKKLNKINGLRAAGPRPLTL